MDEFDFFSAHLSRLHGFTLDVKLLNEDKNVIEAGEYQTSVLGNICAKYSCSDEYHLYFYVLCIFWKPFGAAISIWGLLVKQNKTCGRGRFVIIIEWERPAHERIS